MTHTPVFSKPVHSGLMTQNRQPQAMETAHCITAQHHIIGQPSASLLAPQEGAPTACSLPLPLPVTKQGRRKGGGPARWIAC